MTDTPCSTTRDSRPVVALLVPCGPSIPVPFSLSMDNLLQSMRPDKVKTHRYLNVGRHSVVDARITLTQAALDTPDLTHLMWLDADMVNFPGDSVLRLIEHDLDIVGGLCFNRRNPYMPVMARKQPAELGLGPDATGWMYDYPENSVVEVDRTGAAFLLIKRHVMQTMLDKYGADGVWAASSVESEDFGFCRRAQECGFKIHVDTGVYVGHMADVVVDGAYARRNRTHKWQPWMGNFDRAKQEGTPVASVVIPTYNQKPQYLKAAVWSALGQTVPVEVIVVDDGTSDYEILDAEGGYFDVDNGVRVNVVHVNVEKTAAKTVKLPPGARVLRQKNRGIAGALNTGIRAMATNWFAWLSSDDLFTPDKVEKQLQKLHQSDAKASYHMYDIIGPATGDTTFNSAPVLPRRWSSRLEQRQALLENCCINGSTVMLHRSVIDDMKLPDGGFFDGSYRWSQDYEAWLRVAQKYDWALTDEPLGTKRMDDNLTMSINTDPEKAKLWRREDARLHDQYALPRCETCGHWL